MLELEGGRPFFLGSTVRDENDQLAVALTNPDLLQDGQMRLPLGTLHLALKKFCGAARVISSYTSRTTLSEPVETAVCWHFEADFADISRCAA